MVQGPLLDTNSPLNAEQAAQLNQLLSTLHNDQMTWISGYLAGLAAGGGAANAMVSEAATTAEPLPEITILFGSETGNAQGIAKLAAERAQVHGFQANLANMADFRKPDLKKVENLMVVVSTHGEGDPPDPAEEFYALMHGRKAPTLKGKRFTVLALGDSSYENFCQTGRDFDARLEALGAERIHPRVDCDVDFDDPASEWVDSVLECFINLTGAQPRPSNVVAFSSRSTEKVLWSRKNPYPATVLENLVLNGRGSNKETRHIELSIEDSGLTFEPGDSLGVLPQNNPVSVERLVETLGLNADAEVVAGDGRSSLREALTRSYEITTITRPFLERYAALTESTRLRALLDEEAKAELRQYIHGRHILDVIQDYPVKGLTAEDFIGTLRKLPPRLYSIASSHRVAPDEVHLTVATVRYHSHGLDREGVASTFLADRVAEGETVPVYVDSNPNFRLPTDPQAPIIMVGPGTGVAPFRAFLAEREELGATGRNWLFFGDRNFQSDFLYQTEWLNWRKRSLLTRIDVAFSRDQAEKVYVQHRMRENARELYAWLEEGASFYVCGDGEGMAHDVHQALLDIVREQGGLSDDQSLDYVRRLQKEKRYQKDVY